MKKIITTLILGLVFTFSAQAKDHIYKGFLSNKAVSGYDVVAYFTVKNPVKGKKEFSTSYKGADWLFSSKENLDLFKKSPEKYAPQYGGYCAYALATNSFASSDPKAWTVYKGKLYLNYSKDVRTTWLKDKDNYIEQADKNWAASPLSKK